jgi:hypothetical protein
MMRLLVLAVDDPAQAQAEYHRGVAQAGLEHICATFLQKHLFVTMAKPKGVEAQLKEVRVCCCFLSVR